MNTSLRNKAIDRLATGALAARSSRPVLEIDDLHVQFVTSQGTIRAVEGLGYSVYPGETVAIVGESGSGKTVSALSIMQLLPPGTARITRGSIRLDGRELLKLSDEEMRQIRGRHVAMIFQEPMTSLNPVLKIGLPPLSTRHDDPHRPASAPEGLQALDRLGVEHNVRGCADKFEALIRFVFMTERGAPMTPAGFRKFLSRPAVAEKFQFSVHPHMLRHAPIKTRQRWQGHARAAALPRTQGHMHTVRHTARQILI